MSWLSNKVKRRQYSHTKNRVGGKTLFGIGNIRSTQYYVNSDVLYKYELPSPLKLLENPPEKLQWKRTVKTAIHEYCRKQIHQDIPLYSSLKYFTGVDYIPGSCHTVLEIKGDPIREIQKLSVELRLLTGTYILQSKRVKFCDTEKSSLCKLCNEANEDIEHFLLKCKTLDPVRLQTRGYKLLTVLLSLYMNTQGNPSTVKVLKTN